MKSQTNCLPQTTELFPCLFQNRGHSGENGLYLAEMKHPKPATEFPSPVVDPRISYPLLVLHYWLPVLIGCSLALVMKRATGAALSWPGLALLLAGIGAAYNFDRLIDPPTECDAKVQRIRPLLWSGFVLCCGILVALAIRGYLRCQSLVFAAQTYSFRKNLGRNARMDVGLCHSSI